jgi:hypothetical protein
MIVTIPFERDLHATRDRLSAPSPYRVSYGV